MMLKMQKVEGRKKGKGRKNDPPKNKYIINISVSIIQGNNTLKSKRQKGKG